MSRLTRFAVFAIVLSGAALRTGVTHAQHARRYQPAKPTISPYLNLTQTNLGGLPNYYSLVRPQLQQQSFNQVQQEVQATQTATVDKIQQHLEVRQEEGLTKTGKSARFMTSNSYFLNSSQHYPQEIVTKRR